MDCIPEGLNFILELPPRRDCLAVIEKRWDMSLTGGIDFEGQHFDFPEGLNVGAAVQWLEESLLSVRLAFSGRLMGDCVRCLAKSELAISDDLMYLYFSHGVELGKDTELQSDDGFMPVEVDFFARTLDIGAQVRESLLVLLPLKLLCRDDCAGLCQSCGTDMNEGSCDCSTQVVDPRFGVLQELSIE